MMAGIRPSITYPSDECEFLSLMVVDSFTFSREQISPINVQVVATFIFKDVRQNLVNKVLHRAGPLWTVFTVPWIDHVSIIDLPI